jgi:hypothetical protein
MADAKSELREIKRDGAKPQKNSGRGRHDKGDAVLDNLFLVDYKEYAESFGVSIKGWAKICTDAFRAGGYEPMFKLILGTKDKVRLVVISETMFDDMKKAYLRDLERGGIID